MRKNLFGQSVSFMLLGTADGLKITTGTPTVYITKDNGAQITGAGIKTHKGNGEWNYAPLATDTNANHVAFTMELAGAISQTRNLYPVAFDPSDAVDLGLTNLDATISSRNAVTPNTVTPPSVAAMRTEMDINSTKLDVAVSTRNSVTPNTVIPPTIGELNARTILSASYATDGKQTTAQADLDKLTGADGATLATLQANYAPAKAGDAMTVSDKTGFSLSAAGILAIWHQLLTGITTPSTIGKLIKDFLDATISSRNAITPNIISPPTLAELNARTILSANYATDAKQDTILNRIGAFTGSGINNILGFFQAIFKSDATLPTDMGGTGNPATDSLQAIRDRGDVGWITGGAGGISDILNVVPLIPGSIDLANTATVRLGLMLINSLDDLPSIAEISPGTISIEHKAIGGAAWLIIVTNAACLESAGLIYFDEIFDAASGYSEGDSIRVTFKSQKITVAANDFEITDATGRIFYSEMRQTTGAGVADWNAAEKSDIRGALGVIGTKTTGTGGQIQTLPTFAEIWETALTESYAANNVAPTPAQFLHMLYSVAAQAKNVGAKHQTQKLDGATLAMEFTLDDPNNATSRTRTL